MLWLVGKQSGKPGSEKRKKLVLAACKCARLSLKYVKKGEKQPLKAIQTAEAWAKEKKGVTLQDVRDAAYAAASASASAAYAAVSVAAYAAASTASASYAAFYASYAVSYAAFYDATKSKTFKRCADIVREFYPESTWE